MALVLAEHHHDGGPVFCETDRPQLGDAVAVRVFVPAGAPARAVWVRCLVDGEPRLNAARPEHHDDSGTYWRATVDVVNPVASYRFLIDEGTGGIAWVNGSGLHRYDVSDAHDFRLLADAPPPEWVADAVVYQIFPDRFAAAAKHPAPLWALPQRWDDDPVLPDGPDVGRQWYGGDLAGIEHHLDHLQRLGVTALYLTPFFEGRSNHRYDAVSFDHVDPVLGGGDALASLSAAVHAAGLRILGDLTLNHTGVEHEWFRRAQADPTCDEASFYRFTQHPHDYVSWLGVRSLPKLDHSSDSLAERFYSGRDSAVAHWLKPPYALDGWRIDVANMAGRLGERDLNSHLGRRVRASMDAVNHDTWLLAEHNHDFGHDLINAGWQGAMNYAGFTRPVWTWLNSGGRDVSYLGLPVPLPSQPGERVRETIVEALAVTPWRVWTHSTTLLGSHDTARVRTVVGSRERQEVALALLMTMPGVPQVFAGDEWGLTGLNGEHSRTPMPWNRPESHDVVIESLYRDWITLRREHVALRRGGLRWVQAGGDSLTFLREHPDERLLVHVARGPHRPIRLDLRRSGLVGPAELDREGVAEIETLSGAPMTAIDGVWALPSMGPSAHVYRLPRGGLPMFWEPQD